MGIQKITIIGTVSDVNRKTALCQKAIPWHEKIAVLRESRWAFSLKSSKTEIAALGFSIY
jgi:hypothetical protein